MKEIIEINGENKKIKFSGITSLVYKREFGKNLNETIVKYVKATNKKNEENDKLIETFLLGLDELLEIVYIGLKLADKEFKAGFEEWLESIEVFRMEERVKAFNALVNSMYS